MVERRFGGKRNFYDTRQHQKDTPNSKMRILSAAIARSGPTQRIVSSSILIFTLASDAYGVSSSFP
jgi:hypothetical protein